jgi:3-hydroxyacyl-CoA dehydrogenase
MTKRPDKVIGIHFSSPVPLMPVAEVIRTLTTSKETFEAAVDFVRSLDKEVVKVNLDIAGYVFNRVNLPGTVEAIKLVERGVASIVDIDKAMRLGYGRPIVPFESSDLS